MNNLKVKAAVYLAGYIGAVFVVIAVLQTAAKYLGADFVTNCVIGAVLAWLLYGVYGLILAKLKYDAKVDELTEKRNT